MLTNDTVALYCQTTKLVPYVKKAYQNIICLYDDLYSDKYCSLFPRFHYTDINNLGYDIIIDDLSLYERLKNKNNTIFYYIDYNCNHNIDYKVLNSIIDHIDGVLLPKNISGDLIKIVFNYTKDIVYV